MDAEHFPNILRKQPPTTNKPSDEGKATEAGKAHALRDGLRDSKANWAIGRYL
jgi:hypothetical protein